MKTKLKNRLEGCQRLALLGIGSELRGDDGAGILAVRQLRSLVSRRPFTSVRFEGFEGGSAPENVTGFISAFKPTHIILVDAADIGAPAGTFREIPPAEIPDISFSTHTLPLSIVVNYLAGATGATITVIGIQPASLIFDTPLSSPVKRGVGHLSRLLHETISAVDTERVGNMENSP